MTTNKYLTSKIKNAASNNCNTLLVSINLVLGKLKVIKK